MTNGIISERIMSTSHFTDIEKKLKVMLKPTVKICVYKFKPEKDVF